jgi:aquaporin Z
MKTIDQILVASDNGETLAAEMGHVDIVQQAPVTAISSLRAHWPEYLMEGALLGTFMVSACLFGALFEHPLSPVHQMIDSAFLRRLFIGIAMGGTAIGLIYSPWGKQSGAHINPSVTLTFLRLGKIKFWDALFYILSQFAGAALAVYAVAIFLGHEISDPAVNYVVTVPGMQGPWFALLAEFTISAILMSTVLYVSNHHRLDRFTGIFAGILVATYITFEAPASGMSMNPARTFGSALPAGVWDGLAIYFTAPPLGMLFAAEIYLWWSGKQSVKCCKLHHNNTKRCIFCGANGGFAS